MSRPRCLLSLLVALVVALPIGAGAQEASEPTEAQFKLYEEGSEAFRAGEFRKAVDLFEASLHLGELNITYLNLGRSHFKLGECPEAARAYEAARKAPWIAQPSPSAVRAKIDEYVADLATCPGSVTVRCKVPDALRAKLSVRVGSSGPHTCSGGPIMVPPGTVKVIAVGGPEPMEQSVEVVAMENVEVVFTGGGAKAEVKKSAIKPKKGKIRRRKGKMVLSQPEPEAGSLLLSLSLGTTIGGSFKDDVAGTAGGSNADASADLTETAAFVVGGTLEWRLVSVLSVGLAGWYLPAIAFDASNQGTNVGADGEFSEFDLNGVVRFNLGLETYNFYLVGEGGLSILTPPSGAAEEFDTPFVGLNYGLGLGIIYTLTPGLKIATETRYQHVETTRTISSDSFDLTQNLAGSRLLLTVGFMLGG